jgi:hypothetical protein
MSLQLSNNLDGDTTDDISTFDEDGWEDEEGDGGEEDDGEEDDEEENDGKEEDEEEDDGEEDDEEEDDGKEDDGVDGEAGNGEEDYGGEQEEKRNFLDTITENNKIIFIKNNNLKNVIIKKDKQKKDNDSSKEDSSKEDSSKEDSSKEDNDNNIVDYLVDILSCAYNKIGSIISYKAIIYYGKHVLNYMVKSLFHLYNMIINNNTSHINSIHNNYKKSSKNICKKKIFIKNKSKNKYTLNYGKYNLNCNCNKILHSYLDTEKKIFLLKN